MIKDLDRDIVTIKYNSLNLPDTIQFKGGHQILNTYDAGGRKLRTDYITKHTPILLPIDKDTVCHWDYASGLIGINTTLYVDNKEYEIIRSPVQYTKLNRVHNPEGYVSNFGAYPPAEHYCYYRKDHLGNNREVWRAGYTSGTTGNQIAATTIQRTQYYPSGLPWKYNTSDNPGSQPYKYNGKEFVEMHGWDSYDYGARVMYPAIGPQFMSVDPLCEKYYWISPYAYCLNNPVKYIDPDGKQVFLGLNTPLLGISDPILLSNKPVVTETMSRVGRATTEKVSKIEDHHAIPRALRDNPVIKEARNEGFKFDGKENKIPVDKFSKQTGEGQHGNHPSYTKEIQNKLSDFQKENPSFTGKDALNAARNIVKDVKETIQNNPNTKINDLYKVPSDNIKSYVPVIIEPQKKQ